MSNELLEALEKSHQLLTGFINVAKSGKVAEVTISAFADLCVIEDRIAAAKAKQFTSTNDMLYAVTYIGKPLFCGSVHACWNFIAEMHGKTTRLGEMLALSITIEPAPAAMKPGFVEAA